MKNYLGRIILLVDDYEMAAAFYETNLALKESLMLQQMLANAFFTWAPIQLIHWVSGF
jgi:hypothetical protein